MVEVLDGLTDKNAQVPLRLRHRIRIEAALDPPLVPRRDLITILLCEAIPTTNDG